MHESKRGFPGTRVETLDGTAFVLGDDGKRYISPPSRLVMVHLKMLASVFDKTVPMIYDWDNRPYVDVDAMAEVLELHDAKEGGDTAKKLMGIVDAAVAYVNSQPKPE